MARKILVTGTGTEIGKTYVTAAIIGQLRRRGASVVASKPVSSGCEADHRDRMWSPDGRILIDACGLDPEDWDTHQRLCLERFPEPISPHLAADRAGRILSLSLLTGYCHRLEGGDFVLGEGIGGVMTPLTDSATFLDWAQDLGWPVLLVAGTYLGTLSHTLTALHCLKAAGAEIAGVVLNRSADEPGPPEDVRSTLGFFHPGIPMVVVPRAPAEAPDLLSPLGLAS